LIGGFGVIPLKSTITNQADHINWKSASTPKPTNENIGAGSRDRTLALGENPSPLAYRAEWRGQQINAFCKGAGRARKGSAAYGCRTSALPVPPLAAQAPKCAPAGRPRKRARPVAHGLHNHQRMTACGKGHTRRGYSSSNND